jgi:hypothetical protein
MAAALAAKNSEAQESKTAADQRTPTADRPQQQSPDAVSPSSVSIGASPSVHEVHLQPGQQSIVLVCDCGARTSIQISHASTELTPAAVSAALGTQPSPAHLSTSNSAPGSTNLSASAKSKKADSAHLDDGLPSPIPFRVYELYAYRGTSYNEPVFIDDALLRTGELRFGYHVTVTTDADKGFKLCAPTWLHRLSWGSMYRNHGCQIPGKLIVCAYGFLTPRDAMWSYVDVYRLIQLLGRNWKQRFTG